MQSSLRLLKMKKDLDCTAQCGESAGISRGPSLPPRVMMDRLVPVFFTFIYQKNRPGDPVYSIYGAGQLCGRGTIWTIGNVALSVSFYLYFACAGDRWKANYVVEYISFSFLQFYLLHMRR